MREIKLRPPLRFTALRTRGVIVTRLHRQGFSRIYLNVSPRRRMPKGEAAGPDRNRKKIHSPVRQASTQRAPRSKKNYRWPGQASWRLDVCPFCWSFSGVEECCPHRVQRASGTGQISSLLGTYFGT